jgi:hypothetical protein
MAERTVEMAEAARVLGISTEAVRKRIKRGSLKAQKNGDGQWLVIMDETKFATAAQVDAASASSTMEMVRTPAAIEEALRDEVDVLRDEVTFMRTEISRLETIIVALSQNAKLLNAPQQVPQPVSPKPKMSWWHRLKSKFIGKH